MILKIAQKWRLTIFFPQKATTLWKIFRRHLDFNWLQLWRNGELVKWPLSSFWARQRNSSQKPPNVWVMRLTSHIIQLV